MCPPFANIWYPSIGFDIDNFKVQKLYRVIHARYTLSRLQTNEKNHKDFRYNKHSDTDRTPLSTNGVPRVLEEQRQVLHGQTRRKQRQMEKIIHFN